MSTITKPITVDEYDRMVEDGTIPEDGRVELIEGQLVEKMTQGTKHTTAAEKCRRVIERLVMAGWHVRIERPVRIPERDSEPEPDLAVVRGDVDDYDDHHPGPADVALVVEVARSSLADDRALAQTYGRRDPRLLDCQRRREATRSLCPPRTGRPGRGNVPTSHDHGRDRVCRFDHRWTACRPDRRGGPTPESAVGTGLRI